MGARRKKRREAELEGVNLLELAPSRVADWEEVDGLVVLLRPFPGRNGLGGFFDRFFHRMSANRIRLDEVGSFAWLLLDGDRTVGEVGEAMREQFQEKVEPVEERLGRLIVMLRREGFLLYPGWDEGQGG